MYRLIRHGFKAYLVGGGVRDLLLGKKPKDFDIATDATPRKIKELFGNSRIIGRRFKLVHIFFRSGKIIQVSTFRDFSDEESESDTEDAGTLRPDNKYGTEATDAQRRDLTINGLFYDLSTFSIIDYVGGMGDLREGVVRVIGDPDQRFREDPVRLIRVVRHAARSGFIIEGGCAKSIQRHRERILACPPMRIFEEAKKDLLSGSALEILRQLHEHRLLELLLPELADRDALLLRPHCDFAKMLAVADKTVQQGTALEVRPVLALIALMAYDPCENGKRTVRRFADQDTLSQHLKSCFPKLAVPRRDREGLLELLDLWRRIELDPGAIRTESLARSPWLNELRVLASFLDFDTALEGEISLLDEALYMHSMRSERGGKVEPMRRPGADGRGRRRRGGRGRGRS